MESYLWRRSAGKETPTYPRVSTRSAKKRLRSWAAIVSVHACPTYCSHSIAMRKTSRSLMKLLLPNTTSRLSKRRKPLAWLITCFQPPMDNYPIVPSTRATDDGFWLEGKLGILDENKPREAAPSEFWGIVLDGVRSWS